MIGIFCLLSLTTTLGSSNFSILAFLTAIPSEDSAVLVHVCERASATEESAKEAMEALGKVFKCVTADRSHCFLNFILISDRVIPHNNSQQ